MKCKEKYSEPSWLFESIKSVKPGSHKLQQTSNLRLKYQIVDQMCSE